MYKHNEVMLFLELYVAHHMHEFNINNRFLCAHGCQMYSA